MIGAALANQAVTLLGAPALLPVGARGMGHLGVYAPGVWPMFDHAGIDAANPIGAILAAAMMLRHSFSLEREAAAIEHAVDSALGSGVRTADIATAGRARHLDARDGRSDCRVGVPVRRADAAVADGGRVKSQTMFVNKGLW